MRFGLLFTALCLCTCLTGCAPTPGTQGWGPNAGATERGPFGPASMRVFPLTRLDADAAGKPMIVCHIEFRDAWGDSVKAAGRLQINMSGSTGGSGSRQELPPLAWDIDLSDLKRNTSLYDRATRTYRIQLVDLPATLAASLTAPADGPPAPWRIVLRATLSSPAGGPALLQDEYTLQP
jgi:hypothetical protein